MRPFLLIILMAGFTAGQTDLIGFTPGSRVAVPSKVDALVFSRDGSFLVAGSKAGAFLAKTTPGAAATRFVNEAVRAAAIARDNSKIAAGGESGTIWIASAAGAVGSQFRPHRGAVLSLGFSPDGGRLVSSGADKNVIVSDANSGRELYRLTNPVNKAFLFAGYSARNNSIVAVSEAGSIVEWDQNAGKLLRQSQDADSTVFAAALNTSGAWLALATEFAQINKAALMRTANPSDFYRKERLAIYDLTQGKMAKEIDGVDGQHRSLSFSADSHYLAAVRDKVRGSFVSVYDVQRGVEVEATPSRSGSLAAAFSPDGRWLASAGSDGSLDIFAVSGVQRGTDPGDLAGTKYSITSKLTTPLLTPDKPLRLAVMDLETNGADESLGRAIADQIRNRINGTPNLEVIERRAWTQVINEQNLQMSARIDPLTAVSLGRGLGLQKILFGSVNKLESTYTINVRLIDVATLKNEGEREVTCQRCGLDDLPEAVARLKTALVKE